MCELKALSFARPIAADSAIGSFGERGEGSPDGWAWPGILDGRWRS